MNVNNECKPCRQINNFYFQKKENEEGCTPECDFDNGFGLYYYYIYINNTLQENQYCEKCMNIDNKNGDAGYFLKNDTCEPSCGMGYIVKDVDKHICEFCKEKYIQKYDKCLDYCPPNSRELINNICSFCNDNEYFYPKEKKCVSQCEKNQTHSIEYFNEDNIPFTYKQCNDCEEGFIVIDNNCTNCSGKNYLYNNKSCYRCFCGNDKFNCFNNSNQCDCFSSNNYYGYSCEFYSEVNINDKTLKIISLNDRLIKTSSNYFTYELKANIQLPENPIFLWKFYLNNSEITGDQKYKDVFLTSNNEEIFGINKKMFENEYNTKFNISLFIISKEKIK